ncbi:Nn.00g106630.m01.CDS01 [Neocucurbitaria sp. VM-36]
MADTFASVVTVPEEATDGHFRILDLPAELVSNVRVHLEDNDVTNVRRVCRALRAHSTTAFGTHFFEHLVAILHPTSLVILLEIARHQVLSKFVRRVTISAELVGHTIFPMETDMRPHFAVQESIEKSGLDYTILLDVFKALKNLRAVRIDVGSFGHAEYFGIVDDGIKCGRVHLYEDVLPYEGHETVPGSHVYEVVLQALYSAETRERVDLSLTLWPAKADDPRVFFFNVQSPTWMNWFARKLRCVDTLRFTDPKSMNELISSATDIQDLELQCNHELFSFVKGANETPHGPGFRRLHIDETLLYHKDFVPFLRRHSSTLEDLHLQSIGLPDGSWIEPLEIIIGMRNLDLLFLHALFEQAPYNYSDVSLDYFDRDDHTRILNLLNHDGISVALVGLQSELRTEPERAPYLEAPETATSPVVVFWHNVDLRKATAAADEVIVCVDGEWVLNPFFSYIDEMSSDADEDEVKQDEAEQDEVEQDKVVA